MHECFVSLIVITLKWDEIIAKLHRFTVEVFAGMQLSVVAFLFIQKCDNMSKMFHFAAAVTHCKMVHKD